ncbi:hypothetical protein ACH47Z_29130 [Streptomyces sp. NPDC020192]|uniref:hypothetical protein n=1 Tax=Streptomyces sp. NPDC020192 TaxID=3365066 RepID=UPI0037B705DE
MACTYFRGTRYEDVAVHTAPGRMAWHAGFRLVREDVHYAVGSPVGSRRNLGT